MFRAAQNLQSRPALYAIATVTIVATGAYAGASIKTTTETHKAVQDFKEATVEDKIHELERSKEPLLGKKTMLEEKIKTLRARKDGSGSKLVELVERGKRE